jgi:thiamine kinase-like enzyme
MATRWWLATAGWRARCRDFVELAGKLEAVQAPLPIIFGHHDLLPANFIHDGRRLWLIDFEYAGFGTAMFDLAGIASNSGFDAVKADELLLRYTSVPRRLMRCAAPMRPCSALHY